MGHTKNLSAVAAAAATTTTTTIIIIIIIMTPGLETENTTTGIRHPDHVAHSIRDSWH
jgi:hypothetical protein